MSAHEPDTDLSGRVAVITGTTRGIGKALALALADHGADVVSTGKTVEVFGRLDLLVNNASAIQLGPVADRPVDRFDLLTGVNVRGTYAMTRAALPHLRETQGWVVTNAPPLSATPAPGMTAYAYSKLGMTFVTRSVAGEESDWRTPAVYCDAVLELLGRSREAVSGESFYDEELLRAAGVDDFSEYAVVPGTEPGPRAARMFDPEYTRPDTNS